MPELSVIVPVYNVEPYLKDCVDSILSQTFSDFELILVDDGSTDGSGALCDGYAGKDSRVRVFHQVNAGQSAARNKGVAEAKTGQLCFIDSDDIVNPGLLEAFLSEMKDGTGAVTCERVQGVTPPDGFFQPTTYNTELLEINEGTLLRLLRENYSIYWTLFPCLIRRAIYEKHPLTPGRVMEDNAVACRWLYEAEKVAVIHAPLYFYRKNPNGTMNAAFSPKKLDYLWALEEQLVFYDRHGFRELQGAVAKEYIFTAIWMAERVKKELKDPVLARKVVRQAMEIRKRYADRLRLTDAEERKLFKAAHPTLHQIKKKAGYIIKPAPH